MIAALAALQAWGGNVGIWVNNAGIGLQPTALETVTDEDFDRVFTINMRAIYLASQIVVPHMKAQQSGWGKRHC